MEIASSVKPPCSTLKPLALLSPNGYSSLPAIPVLDSTYLPPPGPPHAYPGAIRLCPRHDRRLRIFQCPQLVRSAPLSLEQRPHPFHDPAQRGVWLLQQPQALGMLRVQHIRHEGHLVRYIRCNIYITNSFFSFQRSARQGNCLGFPEWRCVS